MIHVKYGTVEVTIHPSDNHEIRTDGEGVTHRQVTYLGQDLAVAVDMVIAAMGGKQS